MIIYPDGKKETFFHYLFCSKCATESIKIVKKFIYVASQGGNIDDIIAYNAVAMLREKTDNKNFNEMRNILPSMAFAASNFMDIYNKNF